MTKWHQVFYDRKMPIHLKVKVHKTVVHPITLYRAECWQATTNQEETLHAMELQMLHYARPHPPRPRPLTLTLTLQDHGSGNNQGKDVQRMNLMVRPCPSKQSAYGGKDGPTAKSTRKAPS